MGSSRRVAERMIVERAARCQEIARQLHDMAARLDSYEDEGSRATALNVEAEALRTLASQVERL